MYILILIEFIFLVIFIIWFIWFYSNNEVTLFVKIIVFSDLLIIFGLILLLPLDIYIKIRIEKNNLKKEEDLAFQNLQKVYFLYYWLVSFLCWVVIPIVQYYQDSGYLVWWRKLKYSVVENVKFYVIIGAIGGILIESLLLCGLMKQYELLQFFKSMANCWGLFEIMILFGYSLVQYPRAHWRTAQLKLQLAYLYFKAQQIKIEQEKSIHKLMHNSKEILKIKKNELNNSNPSIDSKEIIEYCDNIISILPQDVQIEFEKEVQQDQLEQKEETDEVKNYNLDSVAIIRTKIKKYYKEVKRSRSKWRSHLKSCFWLQDVLLNERNRNFVIESTIRPPRIGKYANIINRLEWFWCCHGQSLFKYCFAIVLTLMSCLLLISEASLYSLKEISFLGNFVQQMLQISQGVISIQIITLLPLLYMMLNAYYGYFRLRISKSYGLYPYHQTDAPSLLFTCQNFSRIACPLCYNYLEMIKVKDCAFNTVLGEVNLVPVLGQKFTNLFPCLIIIFFLLNYFEIYDRILVYFDLKSYQFTDDYDPKMIEPGAEIVSEQRKEFEQNLENKQIELQIQQQQQKQKQQRHSILAQLIDNHTY